MKRAFSILFAVALVVGFSLVATTPVVAAATYYVATTGTDSNDGSAGHPWLTIQHAVDSVSSGDTIQVATGTYNENVVVWKAVTIKSAVKHGAVVVGQDVGTYASWAYDVFRVIANGATVEGFDIRMYTPPSYPTMPDPWNGHDGVAVKASDVTVRDNRITQSGAPDPFTQWVPATGAAISSIGGALSGVTIEGNEVYHSTGTGLYIYGTDDSQFQSNKIEETQYTGILLWGGSSSNDVTCNEITDCGTQWNYDDGIRFGGNAQGNTATYNTITGSSRDGIRNVASASGNVAHYNSISGNTGYGVNNQNTGESFDARYNWWGANDGPSGQGPGGGDAVSTYVNYVPWACKPTTGGLAYLTPSAGVIDDLTPVPPPAGAPVVLPYGMFSFTVTGLNPGDTVTVTVELPGAVPVGTKWWKYQNGSWYSLPIGSDNGDNIITVALKDSNVPGQGDSDGAINGQITDPGGPGGAAVGWETYPVNKVRVFLPWIVLGLAIVAGASLLVIRRRRIQT